MYFHDGSIGKFYNTIDIDAIVQPTPGGCARRALTSLLLNFLSLTGTPYNAHKSRFHNEKSIFVIYHELYCT